MEVVNSITEFLISISRADRVHVAKAAAIPFFISVKTKEKDILLQFAYTAKKSEMDLLRALEAAEMLLDDVKKLPLNKWELIGLDAKRTIEARLAWTVAFLKTQAVNILGNKDNAS